jgi:hypothetical protein
MAVKFTRGGREYGITCGIPGLKHVYSTPATGLFSKSSNGHEQTTILIGSFITSFYYPTSKIKYSAKFIMEQAFTGPSRTYPSFGSATWFPRAPAT